MIQQSGSSVDDLYAQIDEAGARLHVKVIKNRLRIQIEQAKNELIEIRDTRLPGDDALKEDIERLTRILAVLIALILIIPPTSIL